MDNYDVMAGSCPSCEAADREIDKLEARLDAADRETLATFDVDRARHTAAAALAEKAEKLLEHIEMGWSHGEECIALDIALSEYREVSNV